MQVTWRLFLCVFLSASWAWGFQPEKKAWTIFVYAAGDEIIIKEPTGMTLKRFERVPSLTPDGPVRVVALHDEVDAGDGTGDGFRYVLEHVANPTAKPGPDTKPLPEALIAEQLGTDFTYGDIDSGDPRTLKSFLKWGVKNYPADHYVLILAGHSWGQQGIMQDFYVNGESLEVSTMIKNYEIRRLMQELYREEGLAHPFDLLLIDACTSGQLDVALEWKEVFKYFAASTLETPNNSIPYDAFLEDFIQAIKKFKGKDVYPTFEEHFLKRLVRTYIESHIRGGSLTFPERQIDGVEYFALRMDKVQQVADALTALVKSLPKKMRADWHAGKLKTIENVRDTDYNADVLSLARAFGQYGKDNRASQLVAAAQHLEKSLGISGIDPTFQARPFPFSNYPTSTGAWVSLEVDEVAPLREIAGCLGIKSFSMQNAELADLSPVFIDKDGKRLSAHQFRCNELGEEYREQHPEEQAPKFAERITLDTLFEHRVVWPHAKHAVIVEYPSKTDPQKVGRRVLSLWVPRAGAGTRNIRLGIIAAGKAVVKYVDTANKTLGKRKIKLPAHSILDHFSKNSLYVVEGKASGSHFKHGLGIYFDRDLHMDEWAYVGGRELIERTSFKKRTLEDYLGHLEEKGTLQDHAIQGIDFYRAHRIDLTGWSTFLFSGQLESGSVGNDYGPPPITTQQRSRRTIRSRRHAH